MHCNLRGGASHSVRLTASSLGRCAVQVPFDGVMSSRALFYTLVIGGVFLGLLLLLLSVMMKHNRNLKAHVRSLEKTTLDIDSPLSKMLDFLKLYSEGVQLGPFHVIRGLSKQKASDLQALIIRNSHNLAAPDIQQQLQQSPGLASDITRWEPDGPPACWGLLGQAFHFRFRFVWCLSACEASEAAAVCHTRTAGQNYFAAG